MCNEYCKKFQLGDRVIVSAEGGWQEDSLATVVSDPESMETRQGEDYYYWVEFDTPQDDLADAGPYYKAQILSRYLDKEEEGV